MDSLQKTVDLLYNDRSLMEDILSRVSQVETALNLNRVHQKEVQKDINANIQEAKFATEDKVNEVKDIMDEKTLIVKANTQTLFSKIINKLLKKEVKE